MDANAEINYRLAKWLICNLQHEGLLNKGEVIVIWEKLIEHYQSPFKCVEVIDGNIGDGGAFSGRKTGNKARNDF
jgi:hypothetical protein